MMISPYDDSRLLVVLQIDHSRIAGLLAAHWGNSRFARPQPYASMVLAANEHDMGWWDWEIKPTLDAQGSLPDYIGSSRDEKLGRVWFEFYRHGIERIAERDPYSGLIVLMHGVGLVTCGYGLLSYMGDRTSDPGGREFVEWADAYRQKLLSDLRGSEEYKGFATEEYVWHNYKLMQAFDLMAQFMCNRYPLNSVQRRNGPTSTLSDFRIPIALGGDEVSITLNVQDEKRAIVRPYPFDTDTVELSFPARILPKRTYAGREELLADYYTADRLTINYTLQAA